MTHPGVRQFEFGPYRFDKEQRLLHCGEELIPLPPKVADTLLVLLVNAPRMVEKSDLMKTVWPDTFVEDGALARNISILRKVLEGEVGEGSFIETIPKRGYRFVVPLGNTPNTGVPAIPEPPRNITPQVDPSPVPDPVPDPPSQWHWGIPAGLAIFAAVALWAWFSLGTKGPAPAPLPPSSATLAVFPLQSLAADGSEEYFAQGMTQALITSLARRTDLRVVSYVSIVPGQKQSAMIEAAASDRTIQRALIGTIVRAGGRIRIDAQLIDPTTRAVQWAKSYERDAADVLALQNTVSEAIASEVPGLGVTAPTRNSDRGRISPEALDAYLRGRYLVSRRTEEGLHRAVGYFQQAIQIAPAYAPAYSGLADAWALLGSFGIDGVKPAESMPLAKSAAIRALELDPELPEAHNSLAYVHLSWDWDLDAAGKEFARAIQLNPSFATAHQWYGHYFLARGDVPHAVEQMAIAVRLEPFSPIINVGVGWCWYYAKDYAKAIAQYRFVIEMDPKFPMGYQTLGAALVASGKPDEAIALYRKAILLDPESPGTLSGLATALAESGQNAEARKVLAQMDELSRRHFVPALDFANIYLGLSESTKTLEWVWKAIQERSDYLMYLRAEPRSGKMLANPEFLRALARLHG